MSSDFNTPSDTHIYKFKPWLTLLNILILAFTGILAGLGLIAVILSIVSIFQSKTDYGGFQYFLVFIYIPIIILIGLVILQLILGIIQTFTTSIKTTPEGIEHQVWPLRHIRARWSEIERLDKFLFYDAIYLKSYELISPSLSHTSVLKFFNLSPNVVALSSYSGWPNGQLADDLKRYAPRLFDKQPVAQDLQAQQQEAAGSSISQETRLLAALSHASALFAGLGIFVPLVIYATQKKKSAYLEFHALQAFYYQLIATILGFVFPLCLPLVILIAAFGMAASGDGNNQAPVMLGGMIFIVAIILLMAFSTVAFVIYAGIGAILTYQGKDFRYLIIGKWAEKGYQQP